MISMEAREFRIGNLFDNGFGEIITVSGLTQYSVYFDPKGHAMGEGKPIPLTEDWLLRLGFTWAEGLRMNVIKESVTVCEPDDYEDSVYHSIYFYHNGDCFGFEVSNEWGENGNVMLSKIKYVHQLQNLYFALTGQELTLKT